MRERVRASMRVRLYAEWRGCFKRNRETIEDKRGGGGYCVRDGEGMSKVKS